MDLVNIAKHLLHLTQMEYGFEDSIPSTDEVFASQQLFEILKTFKDSYFNELYTYQTFDFNDEYDEITDEEENIDDYDENQYFNIQNNFTLEAMEDIVEWIDQHPNYAHDWIENQRSLISNYSSRQILNSDHCSFQQEYVSPRTLSFTGERTTEVAVKKKNNITHSYTVQPITSADGQLLKKCLLILREKENEFGKTVEKDLIVPPNVLVRASKSGKSSDEKHRTFLNEVLRPLVGKKFLLFLDCWTTQTDLKNLEQYFHFKTASY
ncbi:unnamed protein product [Rotaria sp. Silwood2]|nr:unnamed protein product [Rotaria sp. Silwood2]CAF3053149.1 unnamed protein product [Rotaria sp. Silwood2]CAF4494113.1 unnamed protein product [Rotaria sp. Silwood2]CAF4494434.1 unnamed protein product [Rotaria sp. Silwood2]